MTAVTQSGKSLRGPLRSPPRASPTMRLRLALPQTHCPASQSIATRRGSSSDGATGVEHLYKLPDAGEPSKDENADTAVGRVAGDATTRRWISAEAGAERSRHVKCWAGAAYRFEFPLPPALTPTWANVAGGTRSKFPLCRGMIWKCIKPHKADSHRAFWRRRSESNRRRRLCRPLHDHSATPPWGLIATPGRRAIQSRSN